MVSTERSTPGATASRARHSVPSPEGGVPGNYRVDVAADTQAEDRLAISLLLQAARDLPWPVSRYRRPASVRRSMVTG